MGRKEGEEEQWRRLEGIMCRAQPTTTTTAVEKKQRAATNEKAINNNNVAVVDSNEEERTRHSKDEAEEEDASQRNPTTMEGEPAKEVERKEEEEEEEEYLVCPRCQPIIDSLEQRLAAMRAKWIADHTKATSATTKPSTLPPPTQVQMEEKDESKEERGNEEEQQQQQQESVAPPPPPPPPPVPTLMPTSRVAKYVGWMCADCRKKFTIPDYLLPLPPPPPAATSLEKKGVAVAHPTKGKVAVAAAEVEEEEEDFTYAAGVFVRLEQLYDKNIAERREKQRKRRQLLLRKKKQQQRMKQQQGGKGGAEQPPPEEEEVGVGEGDEEELAEKDRAFYIAASVAQAVLRSRHSCIIAREKKNAVLRFVLRNKRRAQDVVFVQQWVRFRMYLAALTMRKREEKTAISNNSSNNNKRQQHVNKPLAELCPHCGPIFEMLERHVHAHSDAFLSYAAFKKGGQLSEERRKGEKRVAFADGGGTSKKVAVAPVSVVARYELWMCGIGCREVFLPILLQRFLAERRAAMFLQRSALWKLVKSHTRRRERAKKKNKATGDGDDCGEEEEEELEENSTITSSVGSSARGSQRRKKGECKNSKCAAFLEMLEARIEATPTLWPFEAACSRYCNNGSDPLTSVVYFSVDDCSADECGLVGVFGFFPRYTRHICRSHSCQERLRVVMRKSITARRAASAIACWWRWLMASRGPMLLSRGGSRPLLFSMCVSNAFNNALEQQLMLHQEREQQQQEESVDVVIRRSIEGAIAAITPRPNAITTNNSRNVASSFFPLEDEVGVGPLELLLLSNGSLRQRQLDWHSRYLTNPSNSLFSSMLAKDGCPFCYPVLAALLTKLWRWPWTTEPEVVAPFYKLLCGNCRANRVPLTVTQFFQLRHRQRFLRDWVWWRIVVKFRSGSRQRQSTKVITHYDSSSAGSVPESCERCYPIVVMLRKRFRRNLVDFSLCNTISGEEQLKRAVAAEVERAAGWMCQLCAAMARRALESHFAAIRKLESRKTAMMNRSVNSAREKDRNKAERLQLLAVQRKKRLLLLAVPERHAIDSVVHDCIAVVQWRWRFLLKTGMALTNSRNPCNNKGDCRWSHLLARAVLLREQSWPDGIPPTTDDSCDHWRIFNNGSSLIAPRWAGGEESDLGGIGSCFRHYASGSSSSNHLLLLSPLRRLLWRKRCEAVALAAKKVDVSAHCGGGTEGSVTARAEELVYMLQLQEAEAGTGAAGNVTVDPILYFYLCAGNHNNNNNNRSGGSRRVSIEVSVVPLMFNKRCVCSRCVPIAASLLERLLNVGSKKKGRDMTVSEDFKLWRYLALLCGRCAGVMARFVERRVALTRAGRFFLLRLRWVVLLREKLLEAIRKRQLQNKMLRRCAKCGPILDNARDVVIFSRQRSRAREVGREGERRDDNDHAQHEEEEETVRKLVKGHSSLVCGKCIFLLEQLAKHPPPPRELPAQLQ